MSPGKLPAKLLSWRPCAFMPTQQQVSLHGCNAMIVHSIFLRHLAEGMLGLQGLRVSHSVERCSHSGIAIQVQGSCSLLSLSAGKITTVKVLYPVKLPAKLLSWRPRAFMPTQQQVPLHGCNAMIVHSIFLRHLAEGMLGLQGLTFY